MTFQYLKSTIEHCPICNESYADMCGLEYPGTCEHNIGKYSVVYWDDGISVVYSDGIVVAQFDTVVPLDEATIERWMLLQ